MNFPFGAPGPESPTENLARWSSLYARTIRRFHPCSRIRFFTPEDWEETDQTSLNQGLRRAAATRLALIQRTESRIILPLLQEEGLWAIAVLEGCTTAPSDFVLPELGRMISREVSMARQGRIDQVTGLPNGCHFREELDSLVEAMRQGPASVLLTGEKAPAVLTLALLEIYPWARNAEQGLLYIARAASHLDSLLGETSSVHHFGSGVFGLLWREIDGEQALKMGNGVLRSLKRENFIRTHLGLASWQGPLKTKVMEDSAGISGDELLTQAWEGLQAARQRGPFALCSHAVLNQQADHPLAPPAVEVLRVLRKSWRGQSRFALLLLRLDQQPPAGESRLLSQPRAGEIFVELNQREAFVLLPGADEQQARQWVQELKKRRDPAAPTFSVGAALYPGPGGTRTEMVLNARKALLHTEFYGPNTFTVFDSVSLNISGDIYYAEGDVARAAREYRRGLKLEPTNINLLNSLGVAYAQTNRYSMAMPLFERVLEIEPRNFMALFNLGFACLARDQRWRAISCFEQALGREPLHFDLLLQLGKLYCEAGRHREAVEILSRAEGLKPNGQSEVGYGTVHQYLGQAYRELGLHQEAMASLQRAVRFNPRDGRALSLLGELYALENQGDEIALALCRQAVELDDTHWEYWYRLGRVQRRGRDLEGARYSLHRSLRLRRRNTAAALLLGRIHQEAGEVRRARRLFKQILSWEPDHQQAALSLAGLQPDNIANPSLTGGELALSRGNHETIPR